MWIDHNQFHLYSFLCTVSSSALHDVGPHTRISIQQCSLAYHMYAAGLNSSPAKLAKNSDRVRSIDADGEVCESVNSWSLWVMLSMWFVIEKPIRTVNFIFCCCDSRLHVCIVFRTNGDGDSPWSTGCTRWGRCEKTGIIRCLWWFSPVTFMQSSNKI